MTYIYSKSLKMKSWFEINLFLILLGGKAQYIGKCFI